MDRSPRSLPRELTLLLVGLVLAGMPWRTLRAEVSPPAEDAPPVKMLILAAPPAETTAAAEPACDRVALRVDGPRYNTVKLKWRPHTMSLAVGGLPTTEPAEGPAAARSGADPQSDETTPAPRMSVTVGSADVPAGSLPAPHERSARQLAQWPRVARRAPARFPSDPNLPRKPAYQARPQVHVPARPPMMIGQRPAIGIPGSRAMLNSGATAGRSPRRLAEPAGSLPLPRQRVTRRSEQLERIAQQADRQIRNGYELAGRKAYFAARLEFIRALRLIAQGLDAEHRTTVHSQALAAGLAAVQEAEDFLPDGSRLEADLDISDIVRRHRTRALKNAETNGVPPVLALNCYFTFAQEQLATGAGGELAGSMALRGLGKLHGSLAAQKSISIRAAESKAMVFYQAALLACPRNHMAANDLGVLLAQCGNYQEAETLLKHGLSIYRQSTGWHNLAVVYRRQRKAELARRAEQLSAAARRAETARQETLQNPSNRLVRWVDPGTFARSYRKSSPFQPPASTGRKPPLPKGNRSAQAVRASTDAVVSRPFEANSATRPPAQPTPREPEKIRLCQALGPAAPCPICAVDCSTCDGRRGWEAARMIGWQAYAQGEYVGHERLAHVAEYRLRVDDELDLVYRLTRMETSTPYELNVGDQIRVESFADEKLNCDLIIQPDGTITLRLLGQVRATSRTVPQLRENLEELYKKYYKIPAITVTPLKANTKLEDLRAAVDSRYGAGGQSRFARVTPEGTIALPAIGSVYAQGLTLTELQRELNERYRVGAGIEGIEVIPVLVRRAPRYVYVLGEVAQPGRFELTGPTTLLQAIAMAGSWNNGAHLKQVVIFRRGDDWRQMATMVDLHGTLHGKQPCPAGEIWLSDADVIIVPKNPILVADDFIELVFTRGIYGVFPLSASLNFAKLSSL